ncbi:MAG: Amuc_1102 family pilus-like protein [Kiritimatiellia bacterium]
MISKAGLAAFIGFVSVGVSSLCVQAQERAPAVSEWINLRGVTAEAVGAPDYNVSVRNLRPPPGTSGRVEWLRVYAEYDTAPKWIDEITFTFYVVLQGNAADLPEGAKQNNLFSGSVTYINVPEARRMLADVFLDPNTFARYGKPTYSAVVVTINGEPAAGKANPENSAQSKWWTKETPNAVPLLSRKETPFMMVEHDRLPTIQP